MSIRHRILAIAATTALVLAAAGCGSDTDSNQAAASDRPAAPSETAATEASGLVARPRPLPEGPYVGEWHATLTKKQAAKKGNESYAGAFALTLNDDGTYTTSQSLDGEAQGQYYPEGEDHLIFSQDSGCDKNFRGSGVYRWKVSGDTLVLTNVEPETGGCTGRTDTLTYPVWQRR